MEVARHTAPRGWYLRAQEEEQGGQDILGDAVKTYLSNESKKRRALLAESIKRYVHSTVRDITGNGEAVLCSTVDKLINDGVWKMSVDGDAGLRRSYKELEWVRKIITSGVMAEWSGKSFYALETADPKFMWTALRMLISSRAITDKSTFRTAMNFLLNLRLRIGGKEFNKLDATDLEPMVRDYFHHGGGSTDE